MSAGNEWISYEDPKSIACKTYYGKKHDFGGIMIFSLNTDDYSSYCYYGFNKNNKKYNFPLTKLVKSILFDSKL